MQLYRAWYGVAILVYLNMAARNQQKQREFIFVMKALSFRS